MKSLCMAAAIGAIALAIGGTAPARAEGSVTLSFDPGAVAFAYQDGYWDRDHHWHAWKNAEESRSYRDAHKDRYHAWKHDRDKDMGWSDKDVPHD